MARKKLTTGNSILNASTYQTAIVQPGANTLVLLFVTNTRPLFQGGNPRTPTVSGTGLAWQQVQTVTTAGDDRRLTCFRSMAAAPSAGQISIDFGGETQDLCAWSLFEYDNVDATAIGGAAAVAQSGTAAGNGAALSASLAPSADPMRNLTVGAIMLDANPVKLVAPGAGFTEIDEQTPNRAFGKGATLQTQDSVSALSAISWTWNGGANAAVIVLEVKAAALPTPPPPGPVTPEDPDEPLIRRFEPVLFFHPQESTFPVDAKRYVEHAALWAAGSPFDDKNKWGGMPGDPFPRQPMVPAGKLAAAAGEPGDYLGKPEFLLDGDHDERFLELGGWKDNSGTHEPGVTTASTNVYADRQEIGNHYQNEPALRASRFWYHAELFDTDRLIRLAGQVGAPDLTKIVARLRNPVLLCYYLFFPEHEQMVGKDDCQNVEAKEAACHAGDWECVAIMLETAGHGNTTNARPKFFGLTGSRPVQVQVDGNSVYRPHQFDDEDLTVMKVEAWRPASGMTANQPEVVGEHPRLYVARGSHSLYMSPGSHDVDPFPDGKQSEWCGHYDTPGVTPNDLSTGAEDDLGDDAATFIAKLVGGWALGPLGAIGGLVAAGLEGVLPGPSGFTGFGTADIPAPDEAPPAPGAGKTVRPAGLAIPDGGADVQDWASQEGLALNGRRYYLKVDRVNQVWWPADDHAKGFRGRWGQHVTSDFLPRRSGPKFPPYWKMFLLALADGDARKLLDLNA